VSDKLECPGCNAVSSSVLNAAGNGEPCPFCGLSAPAIFEILGIRRKKADADLKERLEKALVERDRAVTEASALRRVLSEVRHAAGCEYPYKPHDVPPGEPGIPGGDRPTGG
jgi:hypothetical protein